MGALNPGDMIKDHKDVLLPVLGVVVLLFGLGLFYEKGGDFMDTGDIINGNDDGESSKIYESYPEMIIDKEANYQAEIETNYGDISLQLYPEAAPKTVNNFVFLAKDGFYDGLTFHRVVPGFIIQGGDPNGTGQGDPGYKFEDEINPNALGLNEILVKDADFLSGLYNPNNAATAGYAPNSLRKNADKTLAEFYDDIIGYDYDYTLPSKPFEPGVIAMANSGPDTNGSQFFITVSGSDPEDLNGRHTVFGKVLEGMDVVDEISKVATNTQNAPEKEVEIEEITIDEK
jgi:peptidyl-prolyl cis-trans isomerase A (cyclophilin A)